MLRKTFDTIHNSFSSLEVTEWVPVPNHPNHPPLDYQEMLGLEAMNVQDYPIGKLGILVSDRDLLNGYESLEARQQRRREAFGKEGRYEEELMGIDFPGININIKNQLSQGDNQPMSNTINQHGLGDNIAGDKVAGDKIHTQINNNPDLAAAARDIKALLNELSEEYNPNSAKGKERIKESALARIKQDPQLKARSIKAIKAASAEALDQAIEHPVAKVVVEGIKGFMEG